MTIGKIEKNGVVTLKIVGRLDSPGAAELEKEVAAVTAAKELVFDFADVEYLSSAGLRQVILARRKAQTLAAGFSVTNVGPESMRVFRITGVDRKILLSEKR